MPIYEYICQDCGERFELMRPMKDADAPVACQGCESQHTARMMSVFFASSGGRAIATSAPSCASCNSDSCATCGH
jgi:putative FmdB family regulatory protein